jgi:hypothetical protein
MVGQHEDRHVIGRVVTPPAVPRGILAPSAGPAPEHIATHHDRADAGLRLLDHRRARVDLATLLSLLPAPHLEREDPLVQLQAADAERVLLTLVGTGDEPIQRHRQLEPERAHRTLLVPWLAGRPLQLCNLYNLYHRSEPAPTDHPARACR